MIKSEINRLLEDPSTSYWLKDAIVSALKRDSVDAIHDAEILVKALTRITGFDIVFQISPIKSDRQGL